MSNAGSKNLNYDKIISKNKNKDATKQNSLLDIYELN